MMERRFTGKHMLLVLILFFGTIIAVNLLMARFAVIGFNGTVVDNSYVASQRYNEWMEQGEQQEALGWHFAASVDAQRHVVLRLDGIGGATVDAVAEHPLHKASDRPLIMEPVAGGYRSQEALAPGRWRIRAHVRANGQQARFLDMIRVE